MYNLAVIASVSTSVSSGGELRGDLKRDRSAGDSEVYPYSMGFCGPWASGEGQPSKVSTSEFLFNRSLDWSTEGISDRLYGGRNGEREIDIKLSTSPLPHYITGGIIGCQVLNISSMVLMMFSASERPQMVTT